MKDNKKNEEKNANLSYEKVNDDSEDEDNEDAKGKREDVTNPKELSLPSVRATKANSVLIKK